MIFDYHLLFWIAAALVVLIGLGCKMAKLPNVDVYFLFTCLPMGLTYINFFVFNLNRWKTFHLPQTFLFWAVPAVLIAIFAPSHKKRELAVVMLFHLLAFCWVDYLPDWSSWFSSHFPDRRFAALAYWAGVLFVSYFGISILGRRLFDRLYPDSINPNLHAFYLPPAPMKRETAWYLLLLPFILFLAFHFSSDSHFLDTYPFYQSADTPLYSLSKALVWEFLYGLTFITLEFFFRGFIIHSLASRIGWLCIPAMGFFYCLLHFGKPLPECLGSLLGGMALGTISYRNGSIWAGMLCHLSLAWAMDFWALYPLLF
ncbi:MAG: CPBP family intramembrane metalloprotease [Bacteroidia bacterium]|nr:CPBP family intramembrane metalloprotease [Bacteroidia bacterium]